MKPDIGLTEKQLHKSISPLTSLLFDEMVLYCKTRKFHWNVSGESFMELHKLFQAQYTQTEETIDQIAERISKLGGKTIGTMKEFLKHTRLEEHPDEYAGQHDLMKELLKDHETIIKETRKDIENSEGKNHDAGTIDMLTKIMEQHESTSWILRRYLH